MKLRRLGAVVAAAAMVSGLAACGDSGSDSEAGLKIGIKFDQPGLGLKDGDTYTGLDVDIAKYIAEKLGTPAEEIEWVQSVSSQREDMIASGQVDFIVATYSITDERKEKISFAGPYFIAGQDLLVRADETEITGPATMEGKNLCSVAGSTSAQKVKDLYEGINLVEFAGYSECVAALTSGAVDALTTDDTILAGFAAQEANAGKLKVVGETFSVENYGIGLEKGNTELCQSITDAINEMISDGSWQAAVDANLGPAGYVPGDNNPPTPDACA